MFGTSDTAGIVGNVSAKGTDAEMGELVQTVQMEQLEQVTVGRAGDAGSGVITSAEVVTVLGSLSTRHMFILALAAGR